MSEPNWANRTMWTGDNLAIMRGMNSESVDLIYLDPPFNSNRDYSAPIGSKAAGAAFRGVSNRRKSRQRYLREIAIGGVSLLRRPANNRLDRFLQKAPVLSC